ncbi:hypothetical protein OAA01_00680 [Pelagibacteraceae bacterium]|jgi:uncharacterized protein|nr:hypothetical protein [Pelagibacteraceae bacterium]
MITFFEIIIILVLITIQSIFGVGLLLFGTPSFLLLGYDFANTINILMPISITISALQFFRSKIIDRTFIKQYNLFCLPFLILFLVIALKFSYFLDFKILVAFLLVFSSIVIINKKRFSSYKKIFFNSKKYILVGIGCIHGLTNMGGSFLALYSTLISKNIKDVTRYYISYGYLIMGILQLITVLFVSFKILDFSKLYYIFLAVIIYFPTQKIFKNINDKKFSKYINLIALIYGVLILLSYY